VRLRVEQSFIEGKGDARLRPDQAEIVVSRVQQEVAFEGDDCRPDGKRRRRAALDPPVTNAPLVPTAKLAYNVSFVHQRDVIGDNDRDDNISDWKIRPHHVHEVLQNGKRDALGRVDQRCSGGIPASASETGSFAIESGVYGPADAVHSSSHLRGDVVFDAGEDLVYPLEIAFRGKDLRRAAVFE
jgi:hypothetical protein